MTERSMFYLFSKITIASILVLMPIIASPVLDSSLDSRKMIWPYAAAQTSPDVNQQSGTSSAGGSTESSNATDTFLAQGSINQLISGSLLAEGQQQQELFILGGEWILSVKEGQVRDFTARIVMVAEDGTKLHVHTIENLANVTRGASPNENQNANQSQITLGGDNMVAFSGFVDISTNGVKEWQSVAITISIANGDVISIIPNPGVVPHFYGLPIYGLITSLMDESGQPLRVADGQLYYHGRGEGEYLVEDDAPAATTSGDDVNQTGNQEGLRIPFRDEPIDLPTLESNRTDIPIAEKLSDQANYLVQLRWTQFPILPIPGIDYQLFFLNPDQPRATEEIVPPFESNFTAQSRINASVIIQPEILLNFEQVGSYDITVYSASESVLWQENDRPVYGGRDNGLITFEERYRGPITIEISDIKPANPNRTVDSATFTSFAVQ